jgi:hypothetical protein
MLRFAFPVACVGVTKNYHAVISFLCGLIEANFKADAGSQKIF